MIKYLMMDVDGTLTDGKIYVGNDGEVAKAFDVKDGFGIKNIAIPQGLIPIVITGRESKIVEKRCSELGIDKLYQGIHNKAALLCNTVKDLSEVAYIGDDINDLECMLLIKNAGGLTGCPADAVREILAVADFVSSKNGGNGAVRDFIEWINGK